MQPSVDPCKELAHFMTLPSSEEELATILKAVLTPAEIESISQRLCILDGIATGMPQREIAEGLRVGIATVTRGSRVWQEHKKDLYEYFPRFGQTLHPNPENKTENNLEEKHEVRSVPAHRTVTGFGTELPAV